MVKVWGAGLARDTRAQGVMYASALDPRSVDEVRAKIMKFFEQGMESYEVVVPFEDGKTVAQIHEIGNVETKRVTDKGTFFKLKTLPELARQINLERFKI
jgi:50S ribosomal subunit-associated GTPase HflX